MEEQSASASSWFSSSSSSTATVVDKENKYVKNARSLNREYGLEKPLDDTVRLTRRGGATSHIGQSEFYGTKKKTETTSAVALPIFYLSVSEERVHYTHFLYRLVFELYLREGHKCGSNSNSKTCCLCEYYARGVGIKKLATFFLTCDEQIEDPEIEAGRIKYINQALEKLFIERGPPLTLCSYKTLANVFCLFESTPLRLKGVEACHSLIDIINPVQLLATLSTTVVLPKLEREMCRVLELCHLKLSLKKESVEVVPEREQALAMDIELLRLINDAIVDQQNDIRRYERSVCTGSETTELSLEMSRVLRKIYVAHIDVLCQLMAERLACVKF